MIKITKNQITTGIMDGWNNGRMQEKWLYTIIPTFQYSITPIFKVQITFSNSGEEFEYFDLGFGNYLKFGA